MTDRIPTPPSVLSRLRYDPQADIDRARHDPDGFWLDEARSYEWTREPTTGLTWNRPEHGWFADGETNITLNALDRHARGGADAGGPHLAFRDGGAASPHLRNAARAGPAGGGGAAGTRCRGG